jgi:hypothetical protein
MICIVILLAFIHHVLFNLHYTSMFHFCLQVNTVGPSGRASFSLIQVLSGGATDCGFVFPLVT